MNRIPGRIHATQVLIAAIIFLSPLLLPAQKVVPELGIFSNKNRFKPDAEYNRAHTTTRFSPAKSNTIAYDRAGEKMVMTLSDTIRSAGVFKGSYAGKTGRWVMFYDADDRWKTNKDMYAFLDDLKDVEEAARKSDIAKEEVRKRNQAGADRAELRGTLWFILAVAIVILAIVVMAKSGGSGGTIPSGGSIMNTGEKKFNSGNWYGHGNPHDRYQGNTYGHGKPGFTGSPTKGPDGNWYQGGQNVGPKPGNQD